MDNTLNGQTLIEVPPLAAAAPAPAADPNEAEYAGTEAVEKAASGFVISAPEHVEWYLDKKLNYELDISAIEFRTAQHKAALDKRAAEQIAPLRAEIKSLDWKFYAQAKAVCIGLIRKQKKRKSVAFPCGKASLTANAGGPSLQGKTAAEKREVLRQAFEWAEGNAPTCIVTPPPVQPPAELDVAGLMVIAERTFNSYVAGAMDFYNRQIAEMGIEDPEQLKQAEEAALAKAHQHAKQQIEDDMPFLTFTPPGDVFKLETS